MESTLTYTGAISKALADPVPSCPTLLRPQQESVPSLSTAQVWLSPVAMRVHVRSRLTYAGSVCPTVLPSPSWPKPLLPSTTRSPSA